MSTRICVAGYFPPPITGQTLATKHLVDLISPLGQVNSVDLSEGHSGIVETTASFNADKVMRYLRGGKKLRQHLHKHPDSTMLWTSISPQFLGHARDMLTIYPALPLSQRVFALSHWGNFDRLFSSSATATTAKLLLKRLQGIVFNTNHLADKCAAWVPSHQRFIIPNTIDGALCATRDEIYEKRASHTRGNAFHLLFLSNMIKSKGYWDVLEAIQLLHKKGMNIKARFAGNWISIEDKNDFEAFVDTHNLHQIVQHKGPVTDRNAIKQLHLWADVLVFPTYYPTEAHPHVLIEAMNTGTPLITTAHAGIPEMITDGEEGTFVPAQNPEAIADAVTRLTNLDTWTYHSSKAHNRFTTTYSPEIVQKQWQSLLST